MKKGITPIVATIILLLITVALAGLAWTFLSTYYTGLTGKNAQVSDFFCMSNTQAKITIVNTGTDTMNFGTCGPITGTSQTCGDLTITRTDSGATMAASLSAATLASKSSVVFTDTNCTTAGTAKTCTYRITTSSSGIGPNIATVSCSG